VDTGQATTGQTRTGQTQTESEIAVEQAYVDIVYERLEYSAETARELAAEGMARGHIGNEGGLVERDAWVYQASRRIAALNAAHDGLVFGRLDMRDDEARYIGRIGVRDADRDILLIDWRAPAASVFYQATASHPLDAVRRRVLRCRGDRVVGIEDDLLDAENAPNDMVILGEGALLATLSRARDDHMHSVVATIQKEQDDAIRAPVRGATIITGGPGTGKTVVALHRAAYLLYSDRRRFESGGVLVVGPSSVFMTYIERVLPSLGETAVTLRALGAMVEDVSATEHDEPELARIKGSDRMVDVLGRLVSERQPGEPTSFRYYYKDDVLRLDEKQLEGLRARLLAGTTRNRALPHVHQMLIDALWDQVTGERALEKDKDGFLEIIATDNEFIDFVEAWWPPVDALEVWRTLPDRIDNAGDAILSKAECARVAATAGAAPTIEDVPLIDELRYLLGQVPDIDEIDDPLPKQLMSFERDDAELEAAEREPVSAADADDESYAHVLVDEAQDLSPMQWRMIGRRGPRASWTIVGDAAQSSWPDVEQAAAARARALHGKQEHTFMLTTNYRNSAEIYELAARVAQMTTEYPDVPHAVRYTGHEPQHAVVDADKLVSAVREATEEIASQVDGSVAVVTPAAERTSITAELADMSGVRVLDGVHTKGLEFDGVVVVEPDHIISESATGWRTLYVVLTRATQRLTTVGTTDTWRNDIR